MSQGELAWWFTGVDGRPRHAPRVQVREGQTLTFDGPLEPGRSGLHASRRALDALTFGHGMFACRVRVSGRIVEGAGQLCASERETLWMRDASNVTRGLCRDWVSRGIDRADTLKDDERFVLRRALAERDAPAARDQRVERILDECRRRLRTEEDRERDRQWRAGPDSSLHATEAVVRAHIEADAAAAVHHLTFESDAGIRLALDAAVRALAWDATLRGGEDWEDARESLLEALSGDLEARLVELAPKEVGRQHELVHLRQNGVAKETANESGRRSWLDEGELDALAESLRQPHHEELEHRATLQRLRARRQERIDRGRRRRDPPLGRLVRMSAGAMGGGLLGLVAGAPFGGVGALVGGLGLGTAGAVLGATRAHRSPPETEAPTPGPILLVEIRGARVREVSLTGVRSVSVGLEGLTVWRQEPDPAFNRIWFAQGSLSIEGIQHYEQSEPASLPFWISGAWMSVLGTLWGTAEPLLQRCGPVQLEVVLDTGALLRVDAAAMHLVLGKQIASHEVWRVDDG